MLDLNNQISRLEIRSEQLLIHLHSMDKTSGEAKRVRDDLLRMLRELARLKARRQQHQETLDESSLTGSSTFTNNVQP